MTIRKQPHEPGIEPFLISITDTIEDMKDYINNNKPIYPQPFSDDLFPEAPNLKYQLAEYLELNLQLPDSNLPNSMNIKWVESLLSFVHFKDDPEGQRVFEDFYTNIFDEEFYKDILRTEIFLKDCRSYLNVLDEAESLAFEQGLTLAILLTKNPHSAEHQQNFYHFSRKYDHLYPNLIDQIWDHVNHLPSTPSPDGASSDSN